MADFLHIPHLKDVRQLLTKHATKRYSMRSLDKVTHIAVHHSLTKQGSAESYARYHVQNNNWPGIGYHFVIEKDGTIKWCHDPEVKSYHVGKSNGFSVGVCLTGDFRSQEPTSQQNASLYKLLKALMLELNIDAKNVWGHSEFDGYSWKECPVIDMNALRQQLTKRQLNGKPKPQKTIPPKMAGSPLTQAIGLSHYWFKRLNPDYLLSQPKANAEWVTKQPQANPVPSKESGVIHDLITEMSVKGYTVFQKSHKPFNLNLVGVRKKNGTPNAFDDKLYVFWKHENNWNLRTYKVTTDPGLYYLEHPLNNKGTAILKPGQYRSSHMLGMHKGRYKALVQSGSVTVIRDFDRDRNLDYQSGREQTGYFGINIHRANSKQESPFVNKWSAGCQVFANPTQYAEFISLCQKASLEWGNSFTYTLLEE